MTVTAAARSTTRPRTVRPPEATGQASARTAPNGSPGEDEQLWAVAVVVDAAALDDDQAVDVCEHLAGHSATVGYRRGQGEPGVRVTVRLDVTSAGAGAAAALGERLAVQALTAAGSRPGKVHDVHAVTAEQQEADSDQGGVGVDLVGTAEVATRLAVSRQRVHALRATPSVGFPAPLAALSAGPVWYAADIDAWLAAWTRAPGRPAASPADAVAANLEAVNPGVPQQHQQTGL